MSIEITVPALPESVADASLLDWHKQVGEHIRRDELLVEVETDKVVLEVVAPEDGVVAEILQPTGATVMGGDVLARIEPGAAESETEPKSKSKSEPEKPVAPASTPSAAQPADEVAMSPAVRRLVEEHGLNPTDITGSGRDGRVTKEDILAFIGTSVAPDEAPSADAQPASTPRKDAPKKTQDSTGARQEQREPMSRLRRTIANRLVQAQHTTALLTTFNEVNMQPVMDLRTRYKDEFEQKHGTRLGFMSFFVKASVTALQKFPLVNAYIDGDDIVRHNYYDIGIAVASPRGLLVPIVRNCEGLGFAEIEIQIREYGSRAQDGKIGLDDLSGGTFTITNGGTFGSLLSTPILNPPQSAILGMHKIEPRPIAEDGQVVIRPMMYLALSYDHRIIDGKEAVQFVVTIKELLEDPASMLFQL